MPETVLYMSYLCREVDRQRDMSPAVENSRAQIAFYYGNTVRRMVVGKDGYPPRTVP